MTSNRRFWRTAVPIFSNKNLTVMILSRKKVAKLFQTKKNYTELLALTLQTVSDLQIPDASDVRGKL